MQIKGTEIQDEVSYAVMNGMWRYLQEMPFDPGRPRNSRKEATHCVFMFEHAPWESGQGLILYDASDMADGAYNLLELLMQFAPTVDVSEPNRAAQRLREKLGLG